ncbi:MAG: ComF family protein [Deltaproteobacteria bacterium]|nr:ComF family protein [Deltaproteobacteria bacterium]RLB94296.1 MAG: ComF family protein [Deltaproteobacteria bacterium]
MPFFLKTLWQALLETIFPARCLICGSYNCERHSCCSDDSDLITEPTIGYFCESCRKDLVPITSPFCSRCGLPFVSRQGDNHVCSECLAEEKYFRKARAFGVYDGTLMEAIHLFKYGKKTALSYPLSALVKKTFFCYWGRDSIDLLVSVPLHIRRLRERGFNQAHLLITSWAKKEKIPFDGLVLSRTRWTQPQTALGRSERQENIKGAFFLRHPGKIKGKKIMLVDDVYTTGSTVNECARILMKGGAELVDVLTLARAV